MKNIARIVLVILFGALPATVMAFLAAYMTLFASWIALSGQFVGLLMIIWGLAGITGAIALWLAAFRPLTVKIGACLIIGVLAMWPLPHYLVADIRSQEDLLWLFAMIAPVATALLLICTAILRWLIALFSGDSSPEPSVSEP